MLAIKVVLHPYQVASKPCEICEYIEIAALQERPLRLTGGISVFTRPPANSGAYTS